LTRSILEGVAFGLKDMFDLLLEAGLGSIDQVRLSGGGAKSSLWRQILADVLATELVTVNTTEGAAYGAALLAGIGAGIWHDADDACAHTIRVTDRVSPVEQDLQTYQLIHRQYQQLYPALKSTFHAVSVLDQ
jgi:xylulokinase